MTTATSTSTQSKTRTPLTATKIGFVVSDKRDKTRTVEVAYQTRHPKYGKYLKRQSRFQVHDETNASKNGDRVEIANCRPVSKTKSWRLVKVLDQAAVVLEHKTDVE
jgi:small subunit ribosomal protein S17